MIRSELILFLVLAAIFLMNVTGYIKGAEKNRDLTMVEKSMGANKHERTDFKQIVNWLKN